MATKRVPLFPKQLEFITKTEREVLFESGIGGGKTMVGTLWLAMQALKYPETKWLCVARDIPQLRTATLVELRGALNTLEQVEGIDYTWNKSTNEIVFTNGSEIHGRGANNYDSSFRGGNYSGGYGDEVDFWKPEAYLAFKGRIRKYPELIRLGSSPKGYNYIWKEFYGGLHLGSRARVNATTFDNPTLSEDYIESLRSTYSPRLFEQEVMGRRLRLNVGMVYDEFDRDKHVKPCRDKYDPERDQLYFFCDYNISHYCGTYMFMRDDVVYAIGEEHLQNKGTRVLAPIVKSKYPNAIVIGDSAGNNKRDVAADQVNYEIFREAGLITKHFRNPPVESRIISANSNLYHGKCVIDVSCTNLINDLELTPWKEDGSGIDKSDLTLSHSSDGYTYGLWYFLPIRRKVDTRPKVYQL